MISYQSLLSLTAKTLLQRTSRVFFLLCVLLACCVITASCMNENQEDRACCCVVFTFIFIGVVINLIGIKDYDA